ncbi:MAG TPA: phosphatidate cytidylyltransferase [Nitrospira sp.]
MLECGTTNHEPIQAIPKTAARFDPRRVYTVLVLVPLLYAAVRYLPPPLFSGIVALAGALALYELYRLCLPQNHNSATIALGLLGSTALILSPHEPALALPSLLVALLAILSVPLLVPMSLSDRFRESALAITGLLYIGLTLSFLVLTRMLPHGEWLIFFLLFVTWAGDTGAYYAGTLFGRHPLAPRISPKKTMEGLAGGLIAATMVSYLASWWFLPTFSGLDCLLLAILITMTGLWGDLAESAIKRSVGAKDSGAVLPGHGGMLDRLDSLLFSAPAFYYYVTMLSRLGSHA